MYLWNGIVLDQLLKRGEANLDNSWILCLTGKEERVDDIICRGQHYREAGCGGRPGVRGRPVWRRPGVWGEGEDEERLRREREKGKRSYGERENGHQVLYSIDVCIALHVHSTIL